VHDPMHPAVRAQERALFWNKAFALMREELLEEQELINEEEPELEGWCDASVGVDLSRPIATSPLDIEDIATPGQ
jgi:hypothetical protein